MKSKPTTYFLVAVVLAVWGIIAKKILSPAPSPAVVNVVAKPSETKSTQVDTLLLDYRDPFVAAEQVTSIQETDNRIIHPIPAKQAALRRENIDMRCIGKITKYGCQGFLIESAGVQHIIMQGEEIGGFRLVAVRIDSLQFTKNSITYSIPNEH